MRYVLMALLALAGTAQAQDAPGALAASLISAPLLGGVSDPARGSLFAGRQRGSLFAPIEKRGGITVRPNATPTPAARLKDLIASAEAGAAGYDAVQHGARIKPPARPTTLTLAEIDTWIRATPGQPHAIGRYQFIPKTLRRLVRDLGVSPDTVFSPALQDRLADLLLAEAGYEDFMGGTLHRTAFMNNLARIWAGLPTESGRSHYHGHAGNRAVISWARFRDGMAEIFG